MLRLVFWAFLGLYVFALVLLAVGTFGLFGQERDPLSGVFLVPLGLPWNLALDWASEAARPWLAAAAPLLNLGLLWLLVRAVSDRAVT